jgi:nucleoside-diphosphate-sugar epimerase
MRFFLTGSRGSLGIALGRRLRLDGHAVVDYDLIDGEDVLDRERLWMAMRNAQPNLIFHLAGAKHAPEAECEPFHTARTNIEGTENVLRAARGSRVILASTCKACMPETVYGATKLIAERIVLNARGSVARLYNVREASGNVFELWSGMAPPLPATSCYRYFLTMRQAVDLMVAMLKLPPGRYTVNPGEIRCMIDEASDRVGRENVEIIPPRRGDRLREPRIGGAEDIIPLNGTVSSPGAIEQIHGKHDRPC